MEIEVFEKAKDSLLAWRIVNLDYTGVRFPESPADPAFQSFLDVPMGDFERAMVALAGWREQRHNLWPGMASVAQVLVNRTRAGWFHGNLYENVTAKNVIPSMTLYGHPATTKFPNPEDQQFCLFLKILDGVVKGTAKDNTNGALYYGVVFGNAPQFPPFYPEVGEHHITCAKIGDMLFWKEKGE